MAFIMRTSKSLLLLLCTIVLISLFLCYNLMNHQQNVYDKLYDENDALNAENQQVLIKILRYALQTQSFFNEYAHKVENKINRIENEMVSYNLRQIITLNNQHLEIGETIMNTLKDPIALREMYNSGTLEENLNMYYTNIDNIEYLFKHITTTRFRLWKYETTDAGPGVGTDQYLVKYYQILYAVVAEVELAERVHSASKFSNLNISETAVSTIKMQTRLQHPITPTASVCYQDINGKDLVNVDLKKYDNEKGRFLKQQSRETTDFFVAILNGQKSNKSYIRSRAMNYEEEEKGKTMPYLINRDIDSVWRAARKPKHAMHSLITKTEKVADNHCLHFNRFRMACDMNPNHWIKEEPDCPLPCQPKPHFTGMGVCNPPKPGNWKKITNTKVTNYDVFDYLPPSMESMKFEDIQDKEKYIPEMIIKQFIETNLVYLMENVKGLFKDSQGPIPWDDPLRSANVALPDLINQEIESNFKPNGIRPEHVKQYLNKYLNQHPYLLKYQKLLIGDGSKIINKQSQTIWNNQQSVQNKVINDDLKPLFEGIKNTATDEITDETIFRLMQNRINYINSKEKLKKKYEERRIGNNNEEKVENDEKVNNNDDENVDNHQLDNEINNNDSGGFEPFADDSESEAFDTDTDSDSDTDSDTDSEDDAEDKPICNQCKSHKPPPHLINRAVQNQWLDCEDCESVTHWECTPPHIYLVPIAKTWKCTNCSS